MIDVDVLYLSHKSNSISDPVSFYKHMLKSWHIFFQIWLCKFSIDGFAKKKKGICVSLFHWPHSIPEFRYTVKFCSFFSFLNYTGKSGTLLKSLMWFEAAIYFWWDSFLLLVSIISSSAKVNKWFCHTIPLTDCSINILFYLHQYSFTLVILFLH